MDPRVRSVITLMGENLHRKLAARELSEAASLSSTHLRRLFQQETGTSLMRYLRQLRMEHVRRLVETTNLSVKQIAARGGINNVSHFVRDFAKVYGQTPTEYRRRAASKAMPETATRNGRIG